MKLLQQNPEEVVARRSPCGERGLKYGRVAGDEHGVLSLPVRGAWIEISQAIRRRLQASRRSPCGERGLKWHLMVEEAESLLSLPVRGAWIEINQEGLRARNRRSLPVRGAWIEMITIV